MKSVLSSRSVVYISIPSLKTYRNGVFSPFEQKMEELI